MSQVAFTRIRGSVALLTGVIVILFNALLLTGVLPRSVEYPGYLTLYVLFMLTLGSILSIHTNRMGVLLLTGFVLVALDIMLSAGFAYYASFAFPILRDQFPEAVPAVLGGPLGTVSMASMAIGILGNVLFYLGVFRSGILPRWTAIVIIVSQLLGLAMLPYNIPAIIASVGLIGIGYSLVFRESQTVTALEPHPAI